MALYDANTLNMTDDTEIIKASVCESCKVQTAAIKWAIVENCVTLACAVAAWYLMGNPWALLLLLNLFRNKTGLK